MSLVEGRGLERMGQSKVVMESQADYIDDRGFPNKANVDAGEVGKKKDQILGSREGSSKVSRMMPWACDKPA